MFGSDYSCTEVPELYRMTLEKARALVTRAPSGGGAALRRRRAGAFSLFDEHVHPVDDLHDLALGHGSL